MSRRGAALLIALAALVIVLGAVSAGLTTTLAHARTTSASADRLQREALRADAEAIARSWLATHGGELWTSGDAWWQATPVIETTFDPPQAPPLTVAVAVWDVRAGIPAPHEARRLHQRLPEQLQGFAAAPEQPLPRATLDALDLPPGWQRYPAWPAADAGLASAPDQVAALWLGVFGDAAINVRTAPPEVIRATLAGRSRDQLAATLLEQRAAGQPPTIPPDLQRPGDGFPALTASSDRWQVLVAVAAGANRARWWNVVVGGSDGPTRMQRHAIGD